MELLIRGESPLRNMEPAVVSLLVSEMEAAGIRVVQGEVAQLSQARAPPPPPSGEGRSPSAPANYAPARHPLRSDRAPRRGRRTQGEGGAKTITLKSGEERPGYDEVLFANHIQLQTQLCYALLCLVLVLLVLVVLAWRHYGPHIVQQQQRRQQQQQQQQKQKQKQKQKPASGEPVEDDDASDGSSKKSR